MTTYYTVWTNVAFLLLRLGYLHPCLGTSVKLMLMTSSVGGFYITYIYPGEIAVRGVFPMDIVMRGWVLRIGDLVSHQLPFLLALISPQKDGEAGSKIPYLLVLAFYLMGHDPRTQYHLDDQDVVAIFAMVAISYFFF